MNTGTIVLGKFRKCCAGVAMGAMLAQSGEVIANENKLNENNYTKSNLNEQEVITDQWVLINEFDSSER